MSRKTLDRFFILLHHCFYSYKPQICTKQTGLINYSICNSTKNLCSCFQKIKNKHDGGADVAFFVPACVTCSLVERLSALTVIKTKALETWKLTVKIFKRRLQRPHFQRKIYCEMKEGSSQKNYLKSKKNMTAKDKRPWHLFYFTILNRFLLQGSFIFSFLD